MIRDNDQRTLSIENRLHSWAIDDSAVFTPLPT